MLVYVPRMQSTMTAVHWLFFIHDLYYVAARYCISDIVAGYGCAVPLSVSSPDDLSRSATREYIRGVPHPPQLYVSSTQASTSACIFSLSHFFLLFSASACRNRPSAVVQIFICHFFLSSDTVAYVYTASRLVAPHTSAFLFSYAFTCAVPVRLASVSRWRSYRSYSFFWYKVFVDMPFVEKWGSGRVGCVVSGGIRQQWRIDGACACVRLCVCACWVGTPSAPTHASTPYGPTLNFC